MRTGRTRGWAAFTASCRGCGAWPRTPRRPRRPVTGRVREEPWPEADAPLLVGETVEIVVQVNGKLRDRVQAPVGSSADEQEQLARESPRVAAHLDGGAVVKTVVVPDKLVNFVVQ